MEEYLVFQYLNQHQEKADKVIDELGLMWLYSIDKSTINDIVEERLKFGYFNNIEYDPFMTDIDKYYISQELFYGDMKNIEKTISALSKAGKSFFINSNDYYVAITEPEAFGSVFGFVKENANNFKELKETKLTDLTLKNFKAPIEEIKQTKQQNLKL